MIESYGGLPFSEADQNFANRASLENVLYRTTDLIFGHDCYPEIVDKAAAIGWTIMRTHVFHDANKRTGIECCEIFLQLNGYEPFSSDMDVADADIIEVSLAVAKSEMDEESFTDWLRGKAKNSGHVE